MTLEYITMRILESKNTKNKGKVKIFKLKEDNFATIEIECPNCNKKENRKEKWVEPFVSGEKMKRAFFVKCNFCDFIAKIIKLKKQAKKEMKKK